MAHFLGFVMHGDCDTKLGKTYDLAPGAVEGLRDTLVS